MSVKKMLLCFQASEDGPGEPPCPVDGVASCFSNMQWMHGPSTEQSELNWIRHNQKTA